MTSREQRPRPRRRASLVLPALLAAALVLTLLVGISVGRALEDGPDPGGVETRVRTLEPQPLPPATRTVTVTVTGG